MLSAVVYYKPGFDFGVSVFHTHEVAVKDWVEGVFELCQEPQPEDFGKALKRAEELYEARTSDWILDIVPYVQEATDND
jgi:hypothetical protein